MNLPGFAADLTLVMRGINSFYLPYFTLGTFLFFDLFFTPVSQNTKQPDTLNKGFFFLDFFYDFFMISFRVILFVLNA